MLFGGPLAELGSWFRYMEMAIIMSGSAAPGAGEIGTSGG
jgi:hypothetical protein